MTDPPDHQDPPPSARTSDSASACSHSRNDDDKDEEASSWRLDPAQLPRRLDLELPEATLERLENLARQCGRDLNEMALFLIDQQLRDAGGSSSERDRDAP